MTSGNQVLKNSATLKASETSPRSQDIHELSYYVGVKHHLIAVTLVSLRTFNCRVGLLCLYSSGLLCKPHTTIGFLVLSSHMIPQSPPPPWPAKAGQGQLNSPGFHLPKILTGCCYNSARSNSPKPPNL